MSRSSLPILGLALVACSLVLGVSQASASHVSCGDVITENTKLDNDLFCAVGPALTIGADHVKLDLGGHSVVASPPEGPQLAVLNDGYDGVTIRNGALQSSGGAISILDANHNRLEDLQAGGGVGAVFLDASDDNRIVRSSLGGDDFGLFLWNGSDRNVIERNSLEAGIGSPLTITESDDNVVRRNFDFHESSHGLDNGLTIGHGSDNTRVERNEVGLAGSRAGESGANNGVFVDDDATNTLLVRNQVRGYRLNGIQVDSASTTLTRNTSNDNGGWGIIAVPEVIDGGGNTASGNGAGQCLNVSC